MSEKTILVALSRAMLYATALLALPGCYSSTGGRILVDTPEVYTRERIVNDRYDQHAWLRRQLDQTDQLTFGYQALSDIRSFMGFSSQTIAQLSRAKQIEKLLETQPTPGAKPNTGETSKQDLLSQLEKDKTFLHSPAGIQTTQATSSPIDLFRDKLAYREEVRTEMIESQLDDRHDLDGNTLYRLKFDTTVLPDADTSAWAVVNVRVEEKNATDGQSDALALKDLFCRWRKHIEDYIGRVFLRQVLLAQRGKLPPDELVDLILYTEYESHRDQRRHGPSPPLMDTFGMPKFSGSLKGTSQEELHAHLTAIVDTFRQGERPVRSYKGKSQKEALALLIGFRLEYLFQESLERSGFFVIRFDYEQALPRIVVLHPTEGESCTVRNNENIEQEPLKSFKAHLHRATTIYSFAVTPKESVQRISEVASRRDAQQFLLGLSALTGTVQIDQTLNFIKENESLMNAIRRQPLIIGYSETRSKKDLSPSNSFGWILGPKFALDKSGREAAFVHAPIQNALSAAISLPAWWREAKVTVSTCWMAPRRKFVIRSWLDFHESQCVRGSFFEGSPGKKEGSTSKNQGLSGTNVSYTVKLPGDVSALDRILLGETFRRAPVVSHLVEAHLIAGESGRVLIHGADLWRSTVVTVGSQLSERIIILPNMEGIVAEFGAIESSWLADPSASPERREIYVWTSEGEDFAGYAHVHPASLNKVRVLIDVPRYIVTQPLKVTFENTVLPPFIKSATLGIRRFQPGMDNPWTTSAQDLIAGETFVTAKFAASCTNCSSGDLVEAGLFLTRESPSTIQFSYVTKNQAVLYESLEKAQALLKNIGNNNGDITFTLAEQQAEMRFHIDYPANAAVGFRNFNPERSRIVAEGPSGVTITITNQPCVFNAGTKVTTCTYTVHKNTGFPAAPGRGDLKFSLTVKSDTTDDVPEVKGFLIFKT